MITAGADFPIHRMPADDGPPAQRLAQARALYRHAIAEVEIAPHADLPFGWRGAARTLPGLALVAVACSGVHVVRKPIPSADDEIILTAVIAGRLRLRAAGRDTIVQAGEVAMTRRREAAAYDCEPDSRLVELRIAPPPAIARLDPLLASPIPAADPLAMLAKYADVLLDGSGRERSQTLSLAVAHVHEIVDLILDGARAAPSRTARRPSASRLRAIKADIVAGAASRDLSMAALAARHRVTARYIRKLFEAEGLTFSKFLLDERLARAGRMLVDPRRSAETISAIAFACGFGDLSYFNRAFRRRNGATPSEVRATALRGEASGAGGTGLSPAP